MEQWAESSRKFDTIWLVNKRTGDVVLLGKHRLMFSDDGNHFEFADIWMSDAPAYRLSMRYWRDQAGVQAALASLGIYSLPQLSVSLSSFRNGDGGHVFLDLLIEEIEFDDEGEREGRTTWSLFDTCDMMPEDANYSPFALLPWEGPTRGIWCQPPTTSSHDFRKRLGLRLIE